MINKKTVLILGAGASKPYGFPTGRELKHRFLEQYDIERIIGLSNTGPIWGYFFDRFSEGKCKDFYNALKRSGKESVDAFLEHRIEFLDLGKGIIALMLITCENEEYLFVKDNNWYEYFYSQLNAKFEDFKKNNISVITFNYDRSFEHYLLTTIKNDYGKADEEVADILNSIPIIHLHGKLGDLPILGVQNGREYSQKLTPEILQICIDNIKIIHEGIKDDPQFSKAHELLSEADIVCFLGFGYDKTNLDRLKVKEIFTGNQIVFGSTYGLTERECIIISNYIGGNRHMDLSGSLDALKFLRQYAPFI